MDQESFQAYVVRESDQGLAGRVENITEDQLPAGDVTVRVEYSSVNYKDGLASIPGGKIVNQYPFIPGIDLAGVVVKSTHPLYKPGDSVLCTGYGLGVSHFGGFSRYARLNGDWLVPLPQGLSLREAMGIGTAGFTAALSINSLIQHGLTPGQGPVLVTGASGGVGSFAVNMLSKLGYEVTASTGKLKQYREWLMKLGASAVVDRMEDMAKGALGKEEWAAVVDPVGGSQLAGLVKHIRYGGGIALSGMTGGTSIDTTVFPFILRGVQLLGIDSVFCPMELRRAVWKKLAGEWKPEQALYDGIAERRLEDLPDVLATILQGGAVGRTVIRME